mgnify:CR=1 FL=1
MNNPNVLMEVNDHVAVMTISRPEALNAINQDLLLQMKAVIENIEADHQIRVLVITGAGRSFVAGGDIAAMSRMDPFEGRAFVQLGQRILCRIENSRMPVLAAVNGFALGGGCELALACDIRYASDRATFGQPEVNLGITPGFAGSQRLARICGPGVAKDLVLTGRVIDAQQALKIGLVTAVYPADELLPKVMETATLVASRSPVAVQMAKSAINRGYDSTFQTGSQYEVEAFALCMSHADSREGMLAFLEKRKPKWSS